MTSRIAVVMSCFNRREKALACLRSLFADANESLAIEVFLVDDGSSDGTADAVSRQFPAVGVLRGSGSLYWNGGMRLAIETARRTRPDYYLWLNEDTLLTAGALERMVGLQRDLLQRTGRPDIVVAAIADPESGHPTYGGVNFPVWYRRTTPTLVTATDAPVECEAMNGNCVLVPGEVVETIGNLDPAFIHGLGDFDFGLRARRAGFRIWVMPGIAGTCSRNPTSGTYFDRCLPLRTRLRLVLGPKGRPPSAWWVFTRRHCGVLWPFNWVWPYLWTVATWMGSALRGEIRNAGPVKDAATEG